MFKTLKKNSIKIKIDNSSILIVTGNFEENKIAFSYSSNMKYLCSQQHIDTIGATAVGR